MKPFFVVSFKQVRYLPFTETVPRSDAEGVEDGSVVCVELLWGGFEPALGQEFRRAVEVCGGAVGGPEVYG